METKGPAQGVLSRSSGQAGGVPCRAGELTSWIIAQRPPRAEPDPFKPHGVFLEHERDAAGEIVASACILLTNKECPWRCLMCDLWKNALPGPTPLAAIPKQIDFALAQLGCSVRQVKLYNSGSFFDAAAVPTADYAGIANRVAFARRVIVESHPRLVGERTLRFRDLLSGSLEVAMGLETIHPQILPRLNKGFGLGHFARAADFLAAHHVAWRAFVLVQPPFLQAEAAVEWTVKSAEFAFGCGATAVSLIPTRPGNGALDRLMEKGEFSPPRIETLEQAHDSVLGIERARAFADTWDLEDFSSCAACLPDRKRRLEMANLTQQIQPPIQCTYCSGETPIATHSP